MKKAILLLLLIQTFLPGLVLAQQKIVGVSDPVSINIRKEKLPPILSVSNIQFSDTDGNNRIDGLEECEISFEIKNVGKGAASLKMQIQELKNISGLSYNRSKTLKLIQPNSSLQVKIPVKANLELADGIAVFAISFEEQMGFPPDPFELKVETKAFQSPNVQVVDYQFLSDNGYIRKGTPIQLKALVQNIGQGIAKNVKVIFNYPQKVFPNGEEYFEIKKLQPGESKQLIFEFLANKLYTGSTIPVEVNITESWHRYGENKELLATIDATTEKARTLAINSNANDQLVDIQTASLTSDIDKGIPLNEKKYNHRYALIIGNEEYTRYQPGLSSEVNVPFAVADAQVFAEYAERTLGILSNNIFRLNDAISSEMTRAIEKLVKLIKYENGNAEVFVYYAGHGFPDENSKMAYLMPVDISGADVKRGISLRKLYADLTQYPSKRVTVFLDACFSGGGREAGLLAARGVRIRADHQPVGGNLVVFSASTGQQSALPYTEKKHGMFTYFLLKNMKESKGNLTYENLYKKLKSEVELNSIKVNGKDQNPELIFSPDVSSNWQNWNLLE